MHNNRKRKNEEILNPSKELKSYNETIPPLPNIIPFDLFWQDELIYRTFNHIYFRDDVDYETINKLGKLIEMINNEYKSLGSSLSSNIIIQPKPIYLHICSHGGLLLAGLLGCDMILNSKIPIYTIVEGIVASAATLLSIVGKKRYMTSNGFMLIHQLSSNIKGNFEQLKDEFENNTMLMDRIKSLYLQYTKISVKRLNYILKHDKFLDYDEARKYNLVDELYNGDN